MVCRNCVAASPVLGHDHELICFHVLNDLRVSAEPSNLNAFDMVTVAEAEVEPHSMMTLIAAAAVNLVELRAASSTHTNLGTDAVTIRTVAPKLNLDPVIRILGIVSQNRGPGTGIEDNHVRIAVVIEIVHPNATTALHRLHPVAAAIRHVDESSVPGIWQE